MSYILVGLLSFVFMASAEWATYKNIRFLKPFLWFAVIPTATYAFVMAWLNSDRFTFPDILSLIAWFSLLLFFGLFVYSAYVEIPLKTYIASSQPIKVVTNGTYSLSRHPAALWFAGCLVSATIASQSVTLAVAAPFWITAYMCCIILEDRLCSISDFGDQYRKYQGVTPMIIPNRRSVTHFWRNMRSRFYRT